MLAGMLIIFYLVPYTSTFNILDYAAVSFPTGAVVDKEVDKLDASYKPIGDRCKKINEECKCGINFSWYYSLLTETMTDDGNVLHGMPISLQLVARKLEEEKALAMTEQVLKDLC